MKVLVFYFVCLFYTGYVYGQKDSARIKYNLFNPVPVDMMKEMQTDRPDITESAYTVEAGHFQLETDLVKHSRNKSEGLSTTSMAYNVINLKMGLTQKLDVQMVLTTFVNNKTKEINSNKIIAKESGFDDIIVRTKYNLWGGENGKTAMAAMPYVSFPTSSFASNGLQGGIVFPFSLELKKGWNFGTQAGFDLVKEETKLYYADFYYSFTFGKSITEKLNTFVEGYINYGSYAKTADVFANGGIVFSVFDNLNIDAGFNYGINKTADKVFFTGLSFRL